MCQLLKQNPLRSIIFEPLSIFCDLSLTQAIFPVAPKIAKVIPVNKSNDPNQVNYFPVSILSCFYKAFEKILQNWLIDYTKNHHLLYEYQFGFREKHSTSTALIIPFSVYP